MKPAEFFERFFLPLVAGGELHVGAPLGQRGLARLVEAARDARAGAAVTDARMAVAQTLVVEPVPPPLDAYSLRLAVAVHDLLFLLHPAAAKLLVRQGRLAELGRTAATMARLDSTLDKDELVARHTVLHLVPALGRTDVRVSFWAGKQEFHGADPPSRLKAWPEVRRVREERWRSSCFSEAATHPLGAPVVRALLDASPLTDLLNPARAEPRLVLARSVEALRDPEVCRVVVYALLGQGLERTAPPLVSAALAELDGRTPVRGRFVLALVAHLHLCTLLADGPATGRATPPPAELRDFYGLFAALRRAAPELAAPPDVRRDPRLESRLAAHATLCESLCGAARVGELVHAIARGIGSTVQA